jgi:acetolactate synthase-1/2/3 large subunit
MTKVRPRSGGRLLVERLERAGITDAFGMAGHTNVALLDAIADSSIAFHSVRHEQIAAHAADAYFRVKRRPAAVIVHVGPGLTNALTGLGDAAADGSAMVVIAGDIASIHQGKDAFQELSLHADAAQWEVARPLTKRAWKVTAVETLGRAIDAALRVASAGRPGPVLVSVAMDVFSAAAPAHAVPDIEKPPAAACRVPAASSLRQAATLLLDAERAVVLAGGGAIDAHEPLAALVEATGMPVVTTLSGRTSFDEFHGRCLGPIGRTGSPAANRAVAEADVLLAIGTQFPEQDSSSWVRGKTFSVPPTKLIHVDLDAQQIGKIFPATVSVVTDARAAIADLVTLVRENSAESAATSDWLNGLLQEHRAWRRDQVDSPAPGHNAAIHPGFVLQQLTSLLPDDAIVLGDVGWGKNGTSQFVRRRLPRTMLVASGFGTMGWSAAGAIGARIASPAAPVVSITGDGGMSSCLSSLATAAEYGVAVKWIVLNNGVYQSIMGLQQQHFSRTIGTVFGDAVRRAPRTDFAAIARGCGVDSRSVTDPAEVHEAIRWALASEGPVLLDVLTDPEAFPPAAGYWDVHDMYQTT